MRRPRWMQLDGVLEHHELSIQPDTILAIQRDDDGCWSALLFETGSEEVPFMTFQLRAKSTPAAKKEAIGRMVRELERMVQALERLRAA